MFAFGSASIAQTVPGDQAVPSTAGLDLPANLQIFGKADPNVRKPTAIVNDVVVTGTDVDQRVALLIGLNNAQLKPEEREQLRLQVLRQLIDETLEIQEAKANKIEVPKEDIDRNFARIAQGYGRTADDMRAWVKQMGSSDRSIRRQIEGEIAWNRLLGRNVEINVSDQEVDAILKRLQESQGTEEYHPFEIYIGAQADRVNEVFTAEQRLIEQMKQGTPFEYLARSYSESTTRAQGGDLGWIRAQMLPDPLARALQSMQAGEMAGPIEVPGGFSILYLAEKRQVGMADPRDAKLSLRQLSITFPAGTTPEQANTRAASFAEATRGIKGCGDAPKVAASENAELIDRDNVLIRDLPPALQNMMIPLQVGQMTRPFGTAQDGVRVLVICGRDDPPPPGLPSADAIRGKIEEARINLRAQRMLRDLRRDALVEYR